MEIQMVSCQYVGAVGVLLSKFFRQRFGEHRRYATEDKGGGPQAGRRTETDEGKMERGREGIIIWVVNAASK